MRGKHVFATVAVVGSILAWPSPASGHHTGNGQWAWYSGGPPDVTAMFFNYDFRGTQQGAEVDWPVHFIFGNNADVSLIKENLCVAQNFRPYCDSGGPMYMPVWEFDDLHNEDFVDWDSDSGRKQASTCGDQTWREHVRLYAPHITYLTDHSFYSYALGYFVVGTAHLDFHDVSGCAGRAHGYTEVAEDWFIAGMDAVGGWVVSHNCCAWLGNANSFHVAYHGQSYPHYYENDASLTYVHMP